jgi:hypothetical protein
MSYKQHVTWESVLVTEYRSWLLDGSQLKILLEKAWLTSLFPFVSLHLPTKRMIRKACAGF